MKHKVSEMEGALLDAAVAKAEGWTVLEDFGLKYLTSPVNGDPSVRAMQHGPRAWSTSWELGGPIIERERIDLSPGSTQWMAQMRHVTNDAFTGRTPLIAAMRAFVAAKLGDEMELP